MSYTTAENKAVEKKVIALLPVAYTVLRTNYATCDYAAIVGVETTYHPLAKYQAHMSMPEFSKNITMSECKSVLVVSLRSTENPTVEMANHIANTYWTYFVAEKPEVWSLRKDTLLPLHMTKSRREPQVLQDTPSKQKQPISWQQADVPVKCSKPSAPPEVKLMDALKTQFALPSAEASHITEDMLCSKMKVLKEAIERARYDTAKLRQELDISTSGAQYEIAKLTLQITELTTRRDKLVEDVKSSDTNERIEPLLDYIDQQETKIHRWFDLTDQFLQVRNQMRQGMSSSSSSGRTNREYQQANYDRDPCDEPYDRKPTPTKEKMVVDEFPMLGNSLTNGQISKVNSKGNSKGNGKGKSKNDKKYDEHDDDSETEVASELLACTKKYSKGNHNKKIIDYESSESCGSSRSSESCNSSLDSPHSDSSKDDVTFGKMMRKKDHAITGSSKDTHVGQSGKGSKSMKITVPVVAKVPVAPVAPIVYPKDCWDDSESES